ncbi:HEPN-associated N-terminal domain-containing protein [Geodermatophilus normandii]|uniref:RES family NAD+ phosphorylase n=1 Tax=Geodermatophilus normandii TaxID=1137989 RepID=A0A6P0GKA5_9ACTN|nr:HEPN-associated N-terminal domain-containing protein [Geodermatophilus normandii]NEM07737.1 RES family NAD+ phosphorylase [Geodermatophilus normandii]
MNFAMEMHEAEIRQGYSFSDLTVCFDHMQDESLRSELRGWESSPTCNFCEGQGTDSDPIAVEMDALMEVVMSAVFFKYNYANEEGVLRDEGDWFGAPIYESQDVLEDVCSGAVDDEVLVAMISLVPFEDWTRRDFALLPPDRALRVGWDSFAEYVKHTARFVFLATTPRESLSPDEYTPHEILTRISQVIKDLDLIDTLTDRRRLWRGRMQGTGEVPSYKAAGIGPPPARLAAANRMSPAGIPMFYGSESIDTVIAEIAAHDTRRFAVVAAFESTEPLRVVDLTRIPDEPSIFDKNRRWRRYPLRFLRSFAEEISKPVSLDGQEHIDYVPTQVLTEYFRWLSPLDVDGIKFRSAQDDGVNWVVFIGPEGCADPGAETEATRLRLVPDSKRVVRVVARPFGDATA